jgi:Domain of unknown function (DUF4878)
MTRDSKWFALVSIVLIGFAPACNVPPFSARPSSIAREHIYHIDKGELEAATKLMSARWLGENSIDKAKTSFFDNVVGTKERRGVKTIEVRKEDIIGEAAKVELIITFNDEGFEEGYFNMVKESGGWKIDSSRGVMHPKNESPWSKMTQ